MGLGGRVQMKLRRKLEHIQTNLIQNVPTKPTDQYRPIHFDTMSTLSKGTSFWPDYIAWENDFICT